MAAASRAVAAFEHEGQGDVFFRRQRRDQIEGLEDQPDVAPTKEGEVAIVEAAEIGAVDEHPPGIRLGEARHQVQERALARSAGPHDGQELPLVHLQGDPRERRDGAIALPELLGNILDNQRRHRLLKTGASL